MREEKSKDKGDMFASGEIIGTNGPACEFHGIPTLLVRDDRRKYNRDRREFGGKNKVYIPKTRVVCPECLAETKGRSRLICIELMPDYPGIPSDTWEMLDRGIRQFWRKRGIKTYE